MHATSARRRLARAMGAESGLSMIEVLFSSLMLAIVVIGTLNGINTSSHAAAIGRARSQADSFAEQDQERLRSFSITKLRELEEHGGETYTMEADKMKYTVKSTVEFQNNETGTSSCTSTGTAQADYYQTVSQVSWNNGGLKIKPVVETSLIAPPPGASLIVQVKNAEGTGVSGMNIAVKGPTSAGSTTSGKTSTAGCAIFSSFGEGGEYFINVNKTGFVDKDWYANSEEDEAAQNELTLVEGLTTKAGYEFDEAGTITPRLVTVPAETGMLTQTTPAAQISGQALNVTAVNSNLGPPFKKLLSSNLSAPATSISSGAVVFPFTSNYSLFAGTCKADEPKNFEGTATEQKVSRGTTVTPTINEPALVVRVWEKTLAKEEEGYNAAHGYSGTHQISKPITLVNWSGSGGTEECDNARYTPATLPANVVVNGVTVHEEVTPERGELIYPGQAYGKYVVCAEVAAGRFVYQSEVFNKITTATTNGTPSFLHPTHEDGTIVDLYAGYSSSSPPPASLHQGEGTECPLT